LSGLGLGCGHSIRHPNDIYIILLGLVVVVVVVVVVVGGGCGK
jgi:hypothetical protein